MHLQHTSQKFGHTYSVRWFFCFVKQCWQHLNYAITHSTDNTKIIFPVNRLVLLKLEGLFAFYTELITCAEVVKWHQVTVIYVAYWPEVLYFLKNRTDIINLPVFRSLWGNSHFSPLTDIFHILINIMNKISSHWNDWTFSS